MFCEKCNQATGFHVAPKMCWCKATGTTLKYNKNYVIGIGSVGVRMYYTCGNQAQTQAKLVREKIHKKTQPNPSAYNE